MMHKTIAKDFMDARKERSSDVAIYTTLVAEIQKKAKDDKVDTLRDGDVIAIIKKLLASVQESLDRANISDEFRTKMEAEERVLSLYLPQQMSQSEIMAFAQDVIAAKSLKEMNPNQAKGMVMKDLKAAHDGRYDGAMAAKTVADALAQ